MSSSRGNGVSVRGAAPVPSSKSPSAVLMLRMCRASFTETLHRMESSIMESVGDRVRRDDLDDTRLSEEGMRGIVVGAGSCLVEIENWGIVCELGWSLYILSSTRRGEIELRQ